MLDQSVIRAKRNLDSSIQKNRRERVARMMKKVQDAKITTKQKPYIHSMYQNYHQQFCNKFKIKYMEQAKQAFEKGRQQGSIIKDFGNKESVIQFDSKSQISNSNTILKFIDQENEKVIPPEIKPNEIRNINISSQIKTQNFTSEMKKKKAPQEVEIVSKQMEIPKKTQVDIQQQKIILQLPKQPSKNEVKNEVKQEIVKSERQKLKFKQEIKPVERVIPHVQVKKSNYTQQKQVRRQQLFKPQIPIPKSVPINKQYANEEQYEQVQQDSPSIYDMQHKLKQIDQPNKIVTRSQIQPSRQNRQIQEKIEIKNTSSHILNASLNIKVEQKYAEPSRRQEYINLQNINTNKIENNEVQPQKSFDQEEKIINKQEKIEYQQFKEQKQHQKQEEILQKANNLQDQVHKAQNEPQLQESINEIQNNKNELKTQQQYQNPSILTESITKQSLLQIALEQIQQNPFSAEQKHLNNNVQNVQQIESSSRQKAQFEEKDFSQNSIALKEIIQVSQQQKDSQILCNEKEKIIDEKIENKPIQQQIQPSHQTQHLQSLQFDNIENRIDQIVHNFLDFLEKQNRRCDKCERSAEPEEDSEKNSSDDQ